MTISVNLVTDFGAVGDGVTSCVTAFNNFKTFGRLQTQPIILTVPAGTYLIDDITNFNPWFADGVADLTVDAYGATIINCNFGAMAGMFDDNLHSARIATAVAGALSVRLLTPSQVSIFSIGDWVYIGALDLQGFGSPVNHHYFEFQQIDDIRGDQIYLTDILANDYKSTYPVYYTGDGFHPDQGGPATIYRTHPYWNCVNSVYGLTVNSPLTGQIYFKGQACYFEDCTFVGAGIAPTYTRSHREKNCVVSGQTEVDKGVQYLEFDGCTFNSNFIIQSSSIDTVVLTDCTFNADVNGTGKRTTITNCTMPALLLNPIAYGKAVSVHLEDCTIGSLGGGGGQDFLSSLTISNGTLRKLKSAGPIGYAVPDTYTIFGTEGLPPVALITDVRGDDTYTYVDTTLPEPVVIPPSEFGGGGSGTATTRIAGYFGNVTAVNCTGCDEVVDLSLKPVDAPVNSYVLRTRIGDWGISGTPYPAIKVFGWLVSMRVNVVRAYTGAQASLLLRMSQFNQIFAVHRDNTSQADWGAEFNLKIAGERIISPAGNSGQQTGDLMPVVPAEGLWFPINSFAPQNQTASVAGEAEALQPIVELELIFDHEAPAIEEDVEVVPPPSTGGVSPVDPKLLKKYRKELEKRIKDRDKRKAQEAQEEEDNRNALIAAYEAQQEAERQAAEAAARAKEARRNTVTDLDRIMHALELDY